jgi:hypothetical protein
MTYKADTELQLAIAEAAKWINNYTAPWDSNKSENNEEHSLENEQPHVHSMEFLRIT